MHIIECGTDVATIALWDSGVIPADLPARMKADLLGTYEAMALDNRLLWKDVGSDGAYGMYIFVNEEVLGDLVPYLHDPVVVEAFQAPTGDVWLTGAEYVSPNTDPLGSLKHMGGHFNVKPGRYRVTVWRFERPDADAEHERRMQAKFGRSAGAPSWVRGLGCLGLLALWVAIALWVIWGWRWALTCAIPSTLPVLALAFGLSQLPRYKRIVVTEQDVWREFPSLVAKMEWIGEATPTH